jgi:uncharacterized protein (TIGR03067 family)
MVPSTLLFTAFAAAAALAAPVPKALKKDAPLDGRWVLDSQVADGTVAVLPDDQDEWTVSGNTLTIEQKGRRRGVVRAVRCTLESALASAGPRTFEYKVTTNSYHRRGVCEVDGDTLRVAFSTGDSGPPGEVKSGAGVVLYTFRRLTDSQ